MTDDDIDIVAATVWGHCVSFSELSPGLQRLALKRAYADPMMLREGIRCTLAALRDGERTRGNAAQLLQRLRDGRAGTVPS